MGCSVCRSRLLGGKLNTAARIFETKSFAFKARNCPVEYSTALESCWKIGLALAFWVKMEDERGLGSGVGILWGQSGTGIKGEVRQ